MYKNRKKGAIRDGRKPMTLMFEGHFQVPFLTIWAHWAKIAGIVGLAGPYPCI